VEETETLTNPRRMKLTKPCQARSIWIDVKLEEDFCYDTGGRIYLAAIDQLVRRKVVN